MWKITRAFESLELREVGAVWMAAIVMHEAELGGKALGTNPQCPPGSQPRGHALVIEIVYRG